MESMKVLRVGPTEIAQHRDGISINEPMVRALAAVGLFDRSKAPGPDDTATTQQIKDFNAKIEATPAFFWMVTDGNDRRTQVNAGRAYVRAQLAATAQGLSMHPLQQALQEYPEQAGPYAAIHRLVGAQTTRPDGADVGAAGLRAPGGGSAASRAGGAPGQGLSWYVAVTVESVLARISPAR
jgi:hypothetical protein